MSKIATPEAVQHYINKVVSPEVARLTLENMLEQHEQVATANSINRTITLGDDSLEDEEKKSRLETYDSNLKQSAHAIGVIKQRLAELEAPVKEPKLNRKQKRAKDKELQEIINPN